MHWYISSILKRESLHNYDEDSRNRVGWEPHINHYHSFSLPCTDRNKYIHVCIYVWYAECSTRLIDMFAIWMLLYWPKNGIWCW